MGCGKDRVWGKNKANLLLEHTFVFQNPSKLLGIIDRFIENKLLQSIPRKLRNLVQLFEPVKIMAQSGLTQQLYL
ncbi:hypothetical protein LYNGBM3L_03030 [Moorena producens 3L]|uniref:Uncharacterized protein n=1 Tax=Moorena producens 3L TaxID=489825 RepID=F4XIJ7_9CYAN|nr:hypothetical protein LYNGBM3L_03030 [Moorena producens 3L]OLT68874.1 hypothetical protein BI334_31135 [Moorena producens 3L]